MSDSLFKGLIESGYANVKKTLNCSFGESHSGNLIMSATI